MAEAVLTLRRDLPRPSPELVARFQGVPTGWAVDAQGRRGALDAGIRRLVGTGVVVGPAVTVWTAPRDNLAPYAALEVVRPGDVLVIATGDYAGASVLGDLFAGMAKNAGVAAMVTDGLARDISGLRAVGLPIFARGLTPNSPLKQGPGSIGFRIALGGSTVEAGDLVIADEDGVVIVPRGDLERAGKTRGGARQGARHGGQDPGRSEPPALARRDPLEWRSPVRGLSALSRRAARPPLSRSAARRPCGGRRRSGPGEGGVRACRPAG